MQICMAKKTESTMKKYLNLFTLLFITLFSQFAIGEETKPALPKFSYFTLEPEIVTNYITDGRKLGFINIKVELMVDDKSLLKIVEYHQPLIRDTIIGVLSQENEARIKSISGRDAIRKNCLEKVNEILLAEVKKTVLSDLLFTKYLYQ